MAGNDLLSRYREKKNKVTASASTNTGDDLLKKYRSYKTTDTSGVDQKYVESFMNDANTFLSSAKTDYEGLDGNNASSTYTRYNERWNDLSKRAEAVDAWLYQKRNSFDSDTYNTLRKSVADFRSGGTSIMDEFKGASEYYASDEYKNALSAQKQREEMLAYDMVAGEAALKDLETKYNEAREIQYAINKRIRTLKGGSGMASIPDEELEKDSELAQLREQLAQYGDVSALHDELRSKKQYHTLAGREQEAASLASVVDNEDFKQNSKYVNDKTSLRSFDTLHGYINEKAIRDRLDESLIYTGKRSGFSVGEEANYGEMTEDEVAVYNYYYNTAGKEKAQEYLDSIQETLNSRAALRRFEGMEDREFLEMLFGVEAGLDQFKTGIESLFSNEDYIPASEAQILSGMVREDLADNGFTLPDWLGGSSIAQIGYDAVTTTSNMLPSIMISLVPYVGQVAGAVTLGASAAGHAKADMLNLGYTKEQANTYGLMVGASEAGLQYLLGGISKLGGKAPQGLTKLALSKVDNAFARVAITLGANMGAEGLEEGLQTVIEPWLKSLVTGVDFEAPDIDEVLYSSLLGAITSLIMEGGTTVASEVGVRNAGANLKASGVENVTALADLGKGFSEGTAANRLGNKVNVNSSAYMIGRLLTEAGGSLTEQNIADISAKLQAGGMSTQAANDTAKWLYQSVEGNYFADSQLKTLKTVRQRNAEYDTLYNLANDMSKGKKASEASTQQAETTPTTENATEKENATQGKFEASETGKTTLNGSEVKVESVASVKNGNVMLKLNDGNVVNANDVEFSTDEEARLYEAVREEKMDADTANDFVSAYRAAANVLSSHQSVMDYRAGFVEAQTYGRLGIPFEALARDGQYTSGLIGKQAQIAYNRGKVIGINNANATQNAPKKLSAKKITYKEEIHVSNIKKSQAYRGLSETQKAGVDGMVAVYKSLGIDVYFFESNVNRNGQRVGTNGYFNPKDNSIHIDLYAGNDGRGLILFTAAHELTHYIKKNSPAKFKAFADMLFEKYEADGHSVAERLAAKRAKLEQNGRLRGLSEQQIIDLTYEEVVADACEAMLAKGDAFAELSAQVKAKDKGLWEAIKNFFANLVARIKNAYANLNPDSIEGNQVADILETATELQRMWVDMLVEASTQNNASTDSMQGSADNMEDGNYSLQQSLQEKFLFSDRDSQNEITSDMTEEERYEVLKNKKIVAPFYRGEADALIIGRSEALQSREKDFAKTAILEIAEKLKIIKTEINFKDVETKIVISNSSLRESVSKNATPEQIAKLLPILATVAENSIAIERHDNRYFYDTDTVYFDNLLGAYIDGNELVPVRFGLKHSKTGVTTLYVVVDQSKVALENLGEIKNDRGHQDATPDLTGDSSLRRSVTYSLSQIISFVNSKDLLRYIPDGMLNENQRAAKWEAIAETIKYTNEKNDKKYAKYIAKGDIRSAQQMVFAAAKSAGYTIKAYHGSRNIFTVFAEDKKGSNTRTETSKRWFFAGDKKTANSYYPYGVLKELQKQHPDWKFADPEKIKVKGKLYSLLLKFDNPLIVDVAEYDYASHVESADAWMEFAEQAEANNNDGIILINAMDNQLNPSARESTVYMFRKSSQAKSSDLITYDDNGNVIPLSQRFNTDNNDIRYSDRASNKELAEMDDTALYIKNTTKANYIGMIFNGTKTEETRSRRTLDAFIGKDFYVTDGKYVYGSIVLGEPHQYTEEEFHKIENQKKHRVPKGDEYDVKPGGTKWAYPIESYKKFEKPQKLSDSKEYKNSFQARQVKYSDRDTATESTSTRSILSNALESVAKEGEERNILRNYKTNVKLIEAEQAKLAKVKSDANALRFKKGRTAAETKQLEKLDAEAKAISTRINRYDSVLLKMEAMKPIKDILAREKQKAYKRASEAGRKAMEKQKARTDESRSRQAIKADIQRSVKKMTKLFKSKKKDARSNVKDEMRGTIASTLALADLLFANEISNEDIVLAGVDNPSDEESIALNEYRDLLEKRDSLVSEREAIYGNANVTKEQGEKQDKRLAKIEEELKAIRSRLSVLSGTLSGVFERERRRINRSTVGAMINELSIGYKALEKSEFDYISNAYSTVLQSRIDVLATNLGGKTVRDMNHSELAELRDVLKMIEHMIRESNKIFVDGRKAELAEILDDTRNDVIGASFERKELNPNADKVRNFVENFSWNNLRPVDAFARLGSQTFEQLFWDYIDGMGKAGVLVKEAGEVIANARKEYGYDKWDLSHVDNTYTTRDGYQFKPTLADKLSIYAYSQREQAMDHMVDGGFTFDTGADYTIEEDGKKKKLTRRKLSHTFRLTQEDIVKIISSLSNEQTAYVDAILPYLTSLGDKGNEVSLRLYGVKLFNEKVYFPLVSSKDYLNSTDQELGATKTMSSLVNWGAAKPTVPKANNPIVLRAFDDVVLEHIEQMSNYYGLTLPVENLRRVFDNVNRAESGAMPVSTKALIGDRFGIEAQKYFAQLITDLNGGVMSSGAKGPLETLFSRAKGMMVSSNLSVVAQQYFAIARAMELIDPKYFTPFLHGEAKKTDMKQYDEMIKYAPIAIIKEMGGFDVGSRGRVKDYIGYEGANKKSAEYVKKTIDDVASLGASQMDKLGWITIWKAVKAEVASEQSLTPGTEKFYAACKKRFTEIITKTQVFDSVASRSGYMRSKRDFTKMATSFMGEPTVTVGRLYVALNNLARDIRNGNKDGIKSSAMHLVRTTLSVSAATVLSSLAKALVYAGRDDEEDEALLERWTRNFGEALADDINILNSLPYARDLMSLINGFDVERPDTTLLSDIISSVKRMLDGEITAEDSLGLIGSVGNLLGVPLKNLIREIKAAINVIGDLTDNVNPTNIGGAFVSGFTGNERNKSERLYDAVVYGDKQKIAALTNGMTESEITSAIRSAIRENDPRIAEAAMAAIENNDAKRKSLTLEIEREKNFSSTIVRGAINNEIQYIKNKVNEAKRAKGTDKYDDIVQKLLDKYPQRFVDKILK